MNSPVRHRHRYGLRYLDITHRSLEHGMGDGRKINAYTLLILNAIAGTPVPQGRL